MIYESIMRWDRSRIRRLPSGIADHYGLSTYPVEFIQGENKENAGGYGAG